MPVFASHEFHPFSWIDIQTSDRTAAKQFYGGLLGWDFKDMLMPDGRIMYTVARLNGYDVAGMMKIQPEWGEVHPNWLLYFQVENVEASVNLALKLGGESLHEAMDFPCGRLITLKDP